MSDKTELMPRFTCKECGWSGDTLLKCGSATYNDEWYECPNCRKDGTHIKINKPEQPSVHIIRREMIRFTIRNILATSGGNMYYQKCPKCDGQGTVSKPPYVAGDVHQWTSTVTSWTCDVCNGVKVLLVPDVPPIIRENN